MESKTQNQESKKRNPVFVIILAILLIGGGWFGITKYKHSQVHEETDDAQISADISPVIPRVSGYVAEIKVNDNQWVRKGDTLLVLDNRDFVIKLQQAEAALSTSEANLSSARASSQVAKANVNTVKAGIHTIDEQIASAQIALKRATQDLVRYTNLIKDHSITQQQFEQAQAAKETAAQQVAILEGQKLQAEQQTKAAAVQSTATAHQIEPAETNIHQREVDVNAAKLLLSYTVIVAPEDGQVSKINVNEGQFVNAGQAIFSIVHSNEIWVVANFKETQLDKMTEGQDVVVKADVFPRHDFKAKISSFSPATGSTFALLPPDNASGNFVKVVQRLPVRIEFVDKSDKLIKKLRPGMNVEVDVHLNG